MKRVTMLVTLVSRQELCFNLRKRTFFFYQVESPNKRVKVKIGMNLKK